MEAARTLQLHTAAIDVRDGALSIDGLVVDDRTLVELVRRRMESGVDPEHTVRDALEIGARVLDREGTGAEVDYVRRELERMSSDVERGLREQFERFLGGDSGEMSKALESHSEELGELIARHFGSDRATAVQHQVRDVIGKALQESRQDLLRQFSAQDGHNPLADFKGAVIREMKASRQSGETLIAKIHSLEGEIKRLQDARRAEEELTAERERGTSKGRSFEQRAYELIDQMASARGDVAHHVGDERSASGGKLGDVVVEIDAASGAAKGRIAFEVKDEKLSKNRAWETLNGALGERDAGFAVLVVASEEKVPSGREPLHEYEGNKMIVALDKESLDPRPLELAYRYARCRCLMSAEKSLEVDAAGVRDAAEEALSALRDAQKIRASLTGATNSVDNAREALNVMVERVQTAIARVESLIAAQKPAD
jgi:flagellin-like hook-associated protein FlgL